MPDLQPSGPASLAGLGGQPGADGGSVPAHGRAPGAARPEPRHRHRRRARRRRRGAGGGRRGPAAGAPPPWRAVAAAPRRSSTRWP
ncbi:hypothetical protein ACFSTC_30530 [Nonomuraea ferruginea]